MILLFLCFIVGCMSDTTGCALVCCCPCVVAGSLRAQLDERACTPFDALCMSSGYQIRQQTRAKYKIAFAPLKDCLAFCCCGCCALHQEVREVAQRQGKPPQFYMEANTNL